MLGEAASVEAAVGLDAVGDGEKQFPVSASSPVPKGDTATSLTSSLSSSSSPCSLSSSPSSCTVSRTPSSSSSSSAAPCSLALSLCSSPSSSVPLNRVTLEISSADLLSSPPTPSSKPRSACSTVDCAEITQEEEEAEDDAADEECCTEDEEDEEEEDEEEEDEEEDEEEAVEGEDEDWRRRSVCSPDKRREGRDEEERGGDAFATEEKRRRMGRQRRTQRPLTENEVYATLSRRLGVDDLLRRYSQRAAKAERKEQEAQAHREEDEIDDRDETRKRDLPSLGDLTFAFCNLQHDSETNQISFAPLPVTNASACSPSPLSRSSCLCGASESSICTCKASPSGSMPRGPAVYTAWPDEDVCRFLRSQHRRGWRRPHRAASPSGDRLPQSPLAQCPSSSVSSLPASSVSSPPASSVSSPLASSVSSPLASSVSSPPAFSAPCASDAHASPPGGLIDSAPRVCLPSSSPRPDAKAAPSSRCCASCSAGQGETLQRRAVHAALLAVLRRGVMRAARMQKVIAICTFLDLLSSTEMQDIFVDLLFSAPPLRDAPPPKAYLVSLLKCLYVAAELRQLPLSDRFAEAIFEHVSAYSKSDDMDDKPFVAYETLDVARPPQVFTFRILPCRNELGMRTWTAGFFLVEYLATYGHQFRCLSCLCPSLAASPLPHGNSTLLSSCSSLRCSASVAPFSLSSSSLVSGSFSTFRACCCVENAKGGNLQNGKNFEGGQKRLSWSRQMLAKIEAAQPRKLSRVPPKRHDPEGKRDSGDDRHGRSETTAADNRRFDSLPTIASSSSRSPSASRLTSSSSVSSCACCRAFAPLSVLELGSGLGVTASVLCAPALPRCVSGEASHSTSPRANDGEALETVSKNSDSSVSSSSSSSSFSVSSSAPSSQASLPSLRYTGDARLSACCVYVASDFMPSILANCSSNLSRNAVELSARTPRGGAPKRGEASAHATNSGSGETTGKEREKREREETMVETYGGGVKKDLQEGMDEAEMTLARGKTESGEERKQQSSALSPQVFLELFDFADAQRRATPLLQKICDESRREAKRRRQRFCPTPFVSASPPSSSSPAQAPCSDLTSGVLLVVGADLIYDEGLNALLASALATLLRCPLEDEKDETGEAWTLNVEGEERGKGREKEGDKSEKNRQTEKGEKRGCTTVEWRRIAVLCSAVREEATREHFLRELEKHDLLHIEDRRPVARILPYERRRIVVDIIVPREAM
ncbi:hypothetical protein TGME49_254830 [Toxoplasma gondii ME49]|uniref:Methyltransferase n=1 Tax=Toxoplasma gondii (strain ATCC 50611 / Me49) TaxID=508771 RepID=S8GSW5_TOXGM|nr:hypothetical protein TGME49_254830 [Toxoplasma gondii ME49]EPT31674.1 hypothetical protein TGME49_254830 [Toxoplasma gondii ME49]|eukprot:XP_002369537.1 hypothetical protein TGME49_254830 [Toxoplasma gondii ME49]